MDLLDANGRGSGSGGGVAGSGILDDGWAPIEMGLKDNDHSEDDQRG